MKTLTLWIKVTGIMIIILGVIHLVAVVKISTMFQNLPQGQYSVFLFMYMATGAGTILPGLISVFQASELKSKRMNAWITLLVCSLFTIIIGIGAVVQMSHNPFAYMGLILGISLLLPTIIIRKQMR